MEQNLKDPCLGSPVDEVIKALDSLLGPPSQVLDEDWTMRTSRPPSQTE